tara:strand:+ start:281 stop:781 length:501 start_codon:yes stop_codon:yes gene_type:complete
MAKRIGKYKVSNRESAVSLVDGGVASGTVALRGYAATKPSFMYKMPAHATPAAGATLLTIADLLTGMLVQDAAHATTCVWTMPTAALAVAGVAGVQVGDCIDFTIVNNSTTTTDELITLVAGANSTIYGNLVTENDEQDKGSGSSSWRIRFTAVTGTETYVVYRTA